MEAELRAARPRREKAIEWARRYLPVEIAGTASEFGGAWLVYAWTGSGAAAAVAATVFCTVGYYSVAMFNAVRWWLSAHPEQRGWPGLGRATMHALRSVAVEFGPGEVIDSLLFRPLAYWLAPLLVGDIVIGVVVAKVIADVVFYACAIFSYEKFRHVVIGRPSAVPGIETPPVAVMS